MSARWPFRVRARGTCSRSSSRRWSASPTSAWPRGEIGGAEVTVSRTGYSGDLGYEIWVAAPDALRVWDALWESVQGHGVQPFGLDALQHAPHRGRPAPPGRRLRLEPLRLERRPPLHAGRARLELDVPRPRSDDRAFIGRRALEREIAGKTSRWAMRGLVVDWQDYDRVYDEAGLIPPKDHTPVVEDWMVYDGDGRSQVGYATSFMYSPMLQRHIAIARVLPGFARPARG